MIKLLAIPHILTGLIIIGVSLPLMKGKIKRNGLYGIRIPAAFESEERWLEINRYGGRLLMRLGMAILVIAAIGLTLPLILPESFGLFLVYAFGSLAGILGGLSIVLVLTFRYARKTQKA